MPNLPIIGLTFHWLHALPLLAGLFAVGLVAWTLAISERKINLRKQTNALMITKPELHYWNHRKKDGNNTGRTMEGKTSYAPVWFAMGMVCFLAYIATKPFPPPIATEHNVAVLGRFPDGDWKMKSDEQGTFAFRPCPDFDANSILEQAIGYVAPIAKWEERGSCKSIRATGLGFWWRDKDGQYRKVD